MNKQFDDKQFGPMFFCHGEGLQVIQEETIYLILA